MKLSQKDKMLDIMLKNPQKEWFKASDFQSGEWFIGYEATARMSELAFEYPMLIKRSMDGRFRTLGINWDDEKEIQEQKERLELLNNLEE